MVYIVRAMRIAPGMERTGGGLRPEAAADRVRRRRRELAAATTVAAMNRAR